VLIVCPRSDIAGVGIGIKRAFDKFSDIQVRHVARRRRLYDYPTDAEWEERHDLIRWADLIHVMDIPGDYGKPVLTHHHGSFFRANGGPVGICSTLDLHLLGAGEWVPSPIDTRHVGHYKKPVRTDRLTIAHAPTSRSIKGTDAFLAACEGLPVEVLLIEGQSWAECLRLKGSADIYYDQLGLGYGNNAVEAWAMGIPVIAGAQPDTLAEMSRRFPIPFYPATEDTLRYAIADLVSSQVRRDHYARLGLAHVRRFHDEQVVVKQLEAIYRRLV
jgi:hypothetical protein